MAYDFLGPESGPFSGPKSGTRMEQLFGARIGARIEQLFGARGSWLWMFLQGSLQATVSICTFVSTSHSFGARLVYDFSGPESGTRMEQRFGARIRARIEQLFDPGLLAVHVSLGVLWRPPFQSAHLCPPAKKKSIKNMSLMTGQFCLRNRWAIALARPLSWHLT